MSIRHVLAALLVLPLPAAAATAPGRGGSTAKVDQSSWPSFLTRGEVICFDELDFDAFRRTGRFHTRGSVESCTQVGELTRVVVLAQGGGKSQVRIVGGPLEAHVGWTNGRLPLAGPKPTTP